jgi:hypothetical protein
MREAQFFHWKLVAAGSPASQEREAFGYYLSAFLTAADSVTDVAQLELQSGGRIERWRESLPEDDRKFLDIMRGQRNAEVHRRGVKVEEQKARAVFDTFFPTVQPLSMEILRASEVELGPESENGLPHWVKVWGLIPEQFLLAEGRTFGVVTAVRRYLGLLGDMLNFIDKN